jgi:hypothetical protein
MPAVTVAKVGAVSLWRNVWRAELLPDSLSDSTFVEPGLLALLNFRVLLPQQYGNYASSSKLKQR